MMANKEENNLILHILNKNLDKSTKSLINKYAREKLEINNYIITSPITGLITTFHGTSQFGSDSIISQVGKKLILLWNCLQVGSKEIDIIMDPKKLTKNI